MAQEPTWTLGINRNVVLLVKAQAEVEALKSRNAGMMAANSMRVRLGQALAYGEQEFFQSESELQNVAARMAELADSMVNAVPEEVKG